MVELSFAGLYGETGISTFLLYRTGFGAKTWTTLFSPAAVRIIGI
jgi:hypothetical protein